MPTGAKLLGALIFALTGAIAAWSGIPGLPDGRQPGQLVLISALCGAYFGWTLIGKRAPGLSVVQSFVLSFRTVVTMVIATLAIISGYEAYQRSIKLRYDGPIEAVTDVANLMIYFGKMGLQVPVITFLLLGVMIGAVFVQWAGRVWE